MKIFFIQAEVFHGIVPCVALFNYCAYSINKKTVTLNNPPFRGWGQLIFYDTCNIRLSKSKNR